MGTAGHNEGTQGRLIWLEGEEKRLGRGHRWGLGEAYGSLGFIEVGWEP